MEWVLNPIKRWLVTPTIFVPIFNQYILKSSHCYRSQDLQKGDIDDHFYPLVIYKVPFSTMNECQSVEEKLLFRYQLNFFMFNGINKWYLQQQELTIRLLSVTNSLGNTLQFFSRLGCMATYSNRCNLFSALGILHSDIKCQAVALSSPLYSDLMQIHFIHVYILGCCYSITSP